MVFKASLTLLTLGLTFTVSLSPSWSAEECNSQLRRVPFLKIRSNQSGFEIVKNRPHYRLASDGSLHGWSGSARSIPNQGTSNKGTFLLSSQPGDLSILKIFPHRVDEEVPNSFLRKLDGMTLQAMEGGPRILDFGSFSTGDAGPYFFVRMECLFCGTQAVNLKDVETKSGNLITQLEANGAGPLGQFGLLLARAFEDHILPMDPDLFVSEKGEVRWIDGERWIEVQSIRSKSYEFADTFWTLLEYSKRALSPQPDLWSHASSLFYQEFFSKIQSSSKLRPDEKAILISQIFKGKAAQDFNRFSDARLISAPEIVTLFQEASTYYSHHFKNQ